MLYISMSVIVIKLELKLISLCFGVSVPIQLRTLMCCFPLRRCDSDYGLYK